MRSRSQKLKSSVIYILGGGWMHGASIPPPALWAQRPPNLLPSPPSQGRVQTVGVGGGKIMGVLHDVRVIGGGHGMGFGEGGTLPQVMGSGAKPRKLSSFRVFEGRKCI